MVRKWKQEFLKNAHFSFSTEPDCKEAKRKEDTLKKKNDQMLKTIGQLTVERDFFQDCFHQAGAPLPKLPDMISKSKQLSVRRQFELLSMNCFDLYYVQYSPTSGKIVWTKCR